MKILPVLFFAALTINYGQSQGIDLDEIKALTSDSTSKYFYDTLVTEFLKRPYDFEMTKSINLYYGKLYSKYYAPYRFNEQESNFNELLRRENYQRAIVIGEKILENDPVNFEILLKLFKCYLEANENLLAKMTKIKVDILSKAILHSGTGKSIESPLKVTAIGDEYAMIAITGVQGLSRRSKLANTSIIDSWKIQDSEKGTKRDLHFEVLINTEADPEIGN